MATAVCECGNTQDFFFKGSEGADETVGNVECKQCHKKAMKVDWGDMAHGAVIMDFVPGFKETGLPQQKYYNTKREMNKCLESRGLKAVYD